MYATIKENNILEINNLENTTDFMSDLLRNGSQKLIPQALETEFQEFITQNHPLF